MISEMRPSAFSCGTAPSEIAGQLDAVCVHHQRAADLQPAGEIEHGAAIEHGAPGFVTGKGRGAVDAEGLIERSERFGRDEAADDALAVIGLEAVDAHVGGGSRSQIGSNRPVMM